MKKIICKECKKKKEHMAKGLCSDCYGRIYMEEYNKRPEIQARYRARNQRPDIKINQAGYMREYYQDEENKKKHAQYMKDYNQLPETKAKRKLRNKKYNKKPKIKAMRKAHKKNQLIGAALDV